MKLKDWAKKEGISYQTAYRWFKAGDLPVKAYQSESGTIIVQDDNGSTPENVMNKATVSSSDAMSVFLKKTVEYSKANSTIEDFAAYVIANFQLKINPAAPDMSLKYSKNKPSQTDVNKHFQQFIQPKKVIDKAALLDSLPEKTESLKEVVEQDPELKDLINLNYTDQVDTNSIQSFVEEANTSVSFNRPTPTSTVLASSANNLGASPASSYYVGTATVDFSAMPASLMSNVQTNSVVPTIGNSWAGEVQPNPALYAAASAGNVSIGGSLFQPTPRELQTFRSLQETTISEENEFPSIVKKAKRGRPPKKLQSK